MSKILPFPSLRLSIFSGQDPWESPDPDRETTFRCWSSVWGEVFSKEMGLEKKLFSDDFSRQDAIVSLLFGSRCVGLAMIRMVPLHSELTFQDSFFRFWTPDALRKVSDLARGNPIALASSFTVHPDFRGKDQDVNWKALLLALFLEKFKSTGAPVMVTAARKIRSNEKLCQSLGAELLDGDVPFVLDGAPVPGEIADLLYWPGDLSIDLGGDALEALKNRIWEMKKDSSFLKKGARYAA